MPVYLIGTLDTKGQEIAFVRDELRSLGLRVRSSTRAAWASRRSRPTCPARRSSRRPARRWPMSARRTIAATPSRRRPAASPRSSPRLHAEGTVEGVIGLGGSAGTTIATAAMRVLPIGMPKVMASTLASGQVRPYVGDKDILMLNTIVDVSGINRISRIVLGEAARAMAGMVTLRKTSRHVRQAGRCRDDVRRHDALRRAGPPRAGRSRLRSARLSRDGHRRPGDGIADRRRPDRRRPRHYHDRTGRRAGGRRAHAQGQID